MIEWEEFTENFDTSNGGALFVADDPECDGRYLVAGAMWMDGGQDEQHYFAFIAGFDEGRETDWGIVEDRYSAADAFTCSYDSDVAHSLGWFDTMKEASRAVYDFTEDGEDWR